MSLSKDELQLLQDLAASVQTLRGELTGWQQRALALENQNAQLSQQVKELNASNASMANWQQQVTNVVNELARSRNEYDRRLTEFCEQLTKRLDAL